MRSEQTVEASSRAKVVTCRKLAESRVGQTLDASSLARYP